MGGFSCSEALAAFCRALMLSHWWARLHPAPAVLIEGHAASGPPARHCGAEPPPHCSLGTGGFAPIWQTCQRGAPQGWHPTYGVLHFPQGRLEYFVTDIIWRIFAYFGNLTSLKEMSPSTAESLHESSAGFPDPLCSSDFWLKSQCSFGGFLRAKH